MKPFAKLGKGIIAMSALASASALAATFVYVSNAEDGDIGAWSLQADGALAPLARVTRPRAPSPIRCTSIPSTRARAP